MCLQYIVDVVSLELSVNVHVNVLLTKSSISNLTPYLARYEDKQYLN